MSTVTFDHEHVLLILISSPTRAVATLIGSGTTACSTLMFSDMHGHSGNSAYVGQHCGPTTLEFHDNPQPAATSPAGLDPAKHSLSARKVCQADVWKVGNLQIVPGAPPRHAIHLNRETLVTFAGECTRGPTPQLASHAVLCWPADRRRPPSCTKHMASRVASTCRSPSCTKHTHGICR